MFVGDQFGSLIVFVPTDKSACPTVNLHLSGFLLEESEEQADLCVSGFLPETTHTDDSKDRARRATYQPGADKNQGQSVSPVVVRLILTFSIFSQSFSFVSGKIFSLVLKDRALLL